MVSAALTRDPILHYLPRQVKSYSLSFHVTDIKRFFERNKLVYNIFKGVLLQNTWACQQHKYLKHRSREPVANKKMTLGQVVPNFTGQVVSSKILRIFKRKLSVTSCSVPWSKWPWDTKKCRNKLTLSSGTLMFRLKEKFSVFRNFFDQWNFSIDDFTFLHCSALE